MAERGRGGQGREARISEATCDFIRGVDLHRIFLLF